MKYTYLCVYICVCIHVCVYVCTYMCVCICMLCVVIITKAPACLDMVYKLKMIFLFF